MPNAIAPDRLPLRPVEVRQPVQPAGRQHCVRGWGRHVEAFGDLNQIEPLFPTKVHDLAHDERRCLAGLVKGRGGTGRPSDHLPRRGSCSTTNRGESESGVRSQSTVGMGSGGQEGVLGGGAAL